jgi:hypothetical protein
MCTRGWWKARGCRPASERLGGGRRRATNGVARQGSARPLREGYGVGVGGGGMGGATTRYAGCGGGWGGEACDNSTWINVPRRVAAGGDLMPFSGWWGVPRGALGRGIAGDAGHGGGRRGAGQDATGAAAKKFGKCRESDSRGRGSLGIRGGEGVKSGGVGGGGVVLWLECGRVAGRF